MMAPDTGGGSGGGTVEQSIPWTKERLEKASEVFEKIADTSLPLGKACDNQMRGGVLNEEKGTFKDFTPASKQANLNKIAKEAEALRKKDPEAFEAARRLAVAELMGVEDYDEIPDKVTVYRGHDEDESLKNAVNMTVNPEIAEKFGSAGTVSSYEIDKENLSLPLSNSVFGEGEVILFSAKKDLSLTERHYGESKRQSIARQEKLNAEYPIGGKITYQGQSLTISQHGIGDYLMLTTDDGGILMLDFDEVK